MTSMSSNYAVVVTGAGMGGIAFAIAMQRQLSLKDFVIFERATEVGGTWRDTNYPGCSSDVPMPWYCLSTELRADWERPYASGSTIQSYLVDVARKNLIYDYCKFNTSVVSARWDEGSSRWQLVVEDLLTRQTRSVTTKVLVSAIGLFFKPRMPDISGLQNFEGNVFHTAEWKNDLDLRGKRVAVIGNGCSATQVVPAISSDRSVYVCNYGRSPMWFVPPTSNDKYPAALRLIYHIIPVAMRLHRFIVFIMFESRFVAWNGHGSFLNRLAAKYLAWYIRRTAPEQYHHDLTPNYAPGCKRLVVDHGYLAALYRKNLDLSFSPIERVTHKGLLTSAGEVPFDVIICATGYITDSYPIVVRGRNCCTINEYWNSQNGPTAYLGTMLPGFPNFFMLAGPNAASGHASLTFMQETQVNFAIRLARSVLHEEQGSIEPTTAATDSFNEQIQARLVKSVFTKCTSWYRAGADKSGKIVSTWPGPATLFWWETYSVKRSQFYVQGMSQRTLLEAFMWEKTTSFLSKVFLVFGFGL